MHLISAAGLRLTKADAAPVVPQCYVYEHFRFGPRTLPFRVVSDTNIYTRAASRAIITDVTSSCRLALFASFGGTTFLLMPFLARLRLSIGRLASLQLYFDSLSRWNTGSRLIILQVPPIFLPRQQSIDAVATRIVYREHQQVKCRVGLADDYRVSFLLASSR